MKIKLLIVFVYFVSFLNAQKVDEATAIKLLQNVKAEDYPESATISIINVEKEIDSQCLGKSVRESYRKALTDQGKRSINRVYFSYDSDYDTLNIQTIEIIKADGKKIVLNPDSILKKISGNAYSGFSNIYSETSWMLTGNLPDIQVGDIVHTKYTDIIKKARMENNFFDRISVESYSTVLKYWYKLEAPKDLKIYVKHINKKENMASFEKKTQGDKNVYTCSFGNIPQIIYEPGMDDSDFFAYYIMLTTVEKWEDISKWYYGLVKDHLKINKAIKDKVKELTKDAKTKKEKISNIFYWVAQKIRYLGVDKEKNRPGYEPHDVTYTFETRGGVCRDKAALLVAMLREAGIPSDPILISAGYQLNHAAPVMWFNHAVAVSYDENGEPEYFFDPTNETSKDFFPQYEEDDTYIIAREKGADLKIVPVSPASRNNTTINITLNIDKDYNAKGHISISYSGLADTYIRGAFMKYSPNKRKEALQGTLQKIHPAANMTSFKISDPADKNTDMKMEADFEIPQYIDSDGNYIFIPFEASKLSLSFIYNWQLNVFRLTERNYPFKINNTFSVDIKETLNLAQAVKNVSIPEIQQMDYKGFKLNFSNELSEDGKTLKSSVDFSSNKIHFKKEEYKEIKNKLSELENLEKLYLIGNK